ncbi:MAG: hypothetical protein QF632_05950 [Candidatus Woesearchaeota archaeon]|nr:hypothetical protein [Candidatus Woesearchaeota archaeon]
MEKIKYKDEKGEEKETDGPLGVAIRRIANNHIYMPNKKEYRAHFSMYVVKQKDGNRENVNVDNLELVHEDDHKVVPRSIDDSPEKGKADAPYQVGDNKVDPRIRHGKEPDPVTAGSSGLGKMFLGVILGVAVAVVLFLVVTKVF